VPTFFFQTLDSQGDLTDTKVNLDTVEAAIIEARTTLAAIAADGLPSEPTSLLSIEIFDSDRRPLREIRLILEEIDKSITS
jgi:hypothetical protein